ncbi:MAG TPA: DUF3185 family protein [Opitutaceae bacterium]|nr:DUF3185 family protein [Opitutaceae bacterium]
MNKIIGIVLIVVGGFLFFQGLQRKDSLVGGASEVGTKVANAVDGGTRTPKHIIYMVGGGLLVLVGAGVAMKRSSV